MTLINADPQYEQERLQLEQAIFAKLPKAVHKLSCDVGSFIKQNNVTPHNITAIACQTIVQSDPEVQPLVQSFNARHPTQPYTLDNFGSAPEVTQKQAITTHFQHNIEQSAVERVAKKAEVSITSAPEEARESTPKIKPK